MEKYRIGFGVDFHPLRKGRAFWIGGVLVPHHQGAVGHSDADVLLHAICDAILGAANLGDIGKHFPDTDPELEGIDSKILLTQTMALAFQKGFRVVNLDATLCLQAPRIMPFIPAMQHTIASLLKIDEEDISIKATTTERMGFVGREEGVIAYATVLLIKSVSSTFPG